MVGTLWDQFRGQMETWNGARKEQRIKGLSCGEELLGRGFFLFNLLPIWWLALLTVVLFV